MRFDVNLSILFPELPLLARPAAAANLGFDAVELWWPFESEIPGASEQERLAEAIGAAGQTLVSLNLSDGDRAAGEHGLLALPGRQGQFRDNLAVALDLCRRTGCRAINALYGNVPLDVPAAALDEIAVENLAYAARLAAAQGVTVVVEALNSLDFPGYGLHRIEDAVRLSDLVRAETGQDIRLLFDVYHVQRAEGDLIRRMESLWSRFGHVQIADVPGRGHPGTGEIAWERVLPALEAFGYDGFVGLEYRPAAKADETFGWLPAERRRCRDVDPRHGGQSAHRVGFHAPS